jgi:hypothetical protein
MLGIQVAGTVRDNEFEISASQLQIQGIVLLS